MWYALLDPSAIATFGELRNSDGIEISHHGERLVLRTGVERHLEEFRKRPCEIYQDTPSGLVRAGRQIPSLPPLPELLAWTSLREWWQLKNPSAGFVTTTDDLVPLNLVRSQSPLKTTGLLSSLDDLCRYASTAPEGRLAPLRFAASTDGLAWIEGNLLPPLTGTWFTMTDGIACPAGWHWSPILPASSIRQLLEASPDDRLILHADGTWESIEPTFLLPATRENIRASQPTPNLQ